MLDRKSEARKTRTERLEGRLTDRPGSYRKVPIGDLRPTLHAVPHRMTETERDWFSSYALAHWLGKGHVDSARHATLETFGPEAFS